MKENLSLSELNKDFLASVTDSFTAYLNKGTSRSNEKLKPIHGMIAKNLAEMLGDSYRIYALGFGKGKEAAIKGRYMNKRVDIAIFKDNTPIAGIGVKFVMRNYSQNSVNYFENMLGETANIRCDNIPYFQVFITFDRIPYFNADKVISRWEVPSSHNLEKYIKLSTDDTNRYFHTPDKTLLSVLHIPAPDRDVKNDKEYIGYYRENVPKVTESQIKVEGLGNNVIYNDYATFLNKIKLLINFNE